MGWDESSEPQRQDRVLTGCGIDLDQFERLIEQNNYGETEFHD